jgi:hypothetical protein
LSLLVINTSGVLYLTKIAKWYVIRYHLIVSTEMYAYGVDNRKCPVDTVLFCQVHPNYTYWADLPQIWICYSAA